MMAHPELSKYRTTFVNLCEDWSKNTSFDNSKISKEDFTTLLEDFCATIR